MFYLKNNVTAFISSPPQICTVNYEIVAEFGIKTPIKEKKILFLEKREGQKKLQIDLKMKSQF